MLYDAYQAYRDAVAPIQRAAAAAHQLLDAAGSRGAPPLLWRGAAAALELFSHAGLSHERPPFGIRSVTRRRPGNRRRGTGGRRPAVLQSGAFPQGAAAAMSRGCWSWRRCRAISDPCCAAPSRPCCQDHDVYLTDWVNARNVPLLLRPVRSRRFRRSRDRAFSASSGQARMSWRCASPSVPVLAAAALLAAAGEACQPRSMILMGGPIDTRANPTAVNRFATAHPLDWFERKVIATVPARYAGAFRRVYPGFLQLAGLSRHEPRPASSRRIGRCSAISCAATATAPPRRAPSTTSTPR